MATQISRCARTRQCRSKLDALHSVDGRARPRCQRLGSSSIDTRKRGRLQSVPQTAVLNSRSHDWSKTSVRSSQSALLSPILQQCNNVSTATDFSGQFYTTKSSQRVTNSVRSSVRLRQRNPTQLQEATRRRHTNRKTSSSSPSYRIWQSIRHKASSSRFSRSSATISHTPSSHGRCP